MTPLCIRVNLRLKPKLPPEVKDDPSLYQGKPEAETEVGI